MDLALLGKVFGRDQHWFGPCTIIMDAEASLYSLGQDAILGGGTKQYAPRMVSGRILADSVCLLKDGNGLLILQQQKFRQSTGEDIVKQTLTIADPVHVVALEFPDTAPLSTLGLGAPVVRPSSGSHAGAQPRPMLG